MFTSNTPAFVVRVWGNSLALSPLLSIFFMLLANLTDLTYCWFLFLVMFCWGTVISIPGFILFNLAVRQINRRAGTEREKKYWCLAAGNLLWVGTYAVVIAWGGLEYADRLVTITLGSYLLTLSGGIFCCRLEPEGEKRAGSV
ncbi:hypothetical protein DLD77_01590 [Chitinophaga alhagiae]|uniref:Uncharacterized protein n=1 Tax=Chitinophaga alhagiae TaxID=2203219 RepID=A0ABM6W984_9BACT|nr:hypothetical protein [Chitinophaga alhagiae]AWO00490.1 hypothetical protein DLD77_01590 [Chitinophaga alhagiae]